jgi:cation transporter-like permease
MICLGVLAFVKQRRSIHDYSAREAFTTHSKPLDRSRSKNENNVSTQAVLSDGFWFDIALRLIAALLIGGLIGLERSYHGRPAGFRTHVLVCLSTSLLMLVTVYEKLWVPSISQGRISLDPTRMAQGIMTVIGFLGAGQL